MAKYNVKRETKHVPSEVNKMGSAAYKLDPKEELVSTVLTTFVQKSYYEKEKEIMDRFRKAALQVDPLFVAKTAIYARMAANMRSSSHVLAAELAPRISGEEWASRFYHKVINRVDDMSEILSYYRNIMKGKGVPNAMRKGFKVKLESLDPYLIDKYKMLGREISLIDLVNQIHPVPTQTNAEAFRLLMKEGGKGIDKLYSSKILEKEMSKAGKVSKEDQKTVEVAKQEAIESVLGNIKGMPIFNLLRNLRNIILYAPDSVDEAVRQLVIPEKVYKSRLLPFRFLSAHIEISNMGYELKEGTSSSIVFEDEVETRVATREEFSRLKNRVLTALETAIELSCHNIPELEGRVAILIDHSGSMRGDGGGASLVSVLSRTTVVDIANLFAAMLLSKQPSVYVGLFGDRLIQYRLDREMSILQMTRDIYSRGRACGGATEHGIFTFFEELISSRTPVDHIIVFSDMVIGAENRWYGVPGSGKGSGRFQETFREFRKLYPATKVVSVNIHQTDGTTVFNKNYGVTQVAGWSEKIFDVIAEGGAGYKAIIEEIEKIVI
jgi:60 kDa SS-A/Ro ribonucleoprotein